MIPQGAVLPKGVTLKRFDDFDSIRSGIFDKVKSAYETTFPLENDKYRLELSDVRYPDKKYDFRDEKKAILSDQTLSIPLYGKITLIDKTTQEPLDEVQGVLARVPYMTHRGTYINNGNEYSLVAGQQRLKPGAYARRKDNGELEAHCLRGESKIWTENGLISIRQIVKEKMNIRVWSYDFETNDFVLKPIVGWFKNKASEKLIRTSFCSNGRLPSFLNQTPPTTLWSTPDHKIYNLDGSKKEINSSDVGLFAFEQLSPSQEQILLGSFLGDGHITKNGIFQDAHSCDQKEYLQFKKEVFGSLGGDIKSFKSQKHKIAQKEIVSKNGFKFSTKAFWRFREIREKYYKDGIKVVNDELLDQVKELGLAIWFCDDGNATRKKNKNKTTSCLSLDIATQSFSTESIETIIKWFFNRWGIVVSKTKIKLYKDKDMGWTIHMYGENAEKFATLIAPYILPSMEYKLGGLFPQTTEDANSKRNRALKSWINIQNIKGSKLSDVRSDNKTKLTLGYVEITPTRVDKCSISNYKTVYDIEVKDTHCYFANGLLVSNCNLSAGTGKGFRLFMEPETGVYRIMVGKSRMRLYPVLKGMGVDDREMEKWWGPEILNVNKGSKDDEKTFNKFYQKFMGRKALVNASAKEKTLSLLEELQRGEVDEEVAERNLGMKQKFLSPQMILRSSQKLLNIQKGLEEEDDRDSLANKTFVGQEDLFEERVKKDSGMLAKKLLSRSSYNKKITGWVNGYFSPQLDGLISGNSLANAIDGINPIQIMDFGYRVVQTGEGAIEDSEAIPMKARALHPSQAMAIDPIKTSESQNVGIDQRFAIGAMKGSDRNVYIPLRNVKTGKIEYLTPAQMSKKVVGFPKHKRLMPEAPPSAAGMLNF